MWKLQCSSRFSAVMGNGDDCSVLYKLCVYVWVHMCGVGTYVWCGYICVVWVWMFLLPNCSGR